MKNNIKQMFLLVLSLGCFILVLNSENFIENLSLRIGFNVLLLLMGFSLMKLGDTLAEERMERLRLNKLAKTLIFFGIALGIVLAVAVLAYFYL